MVRTRGPVLWTPPNLIPSHHTTENQTVAFNIQARVNFKSCRRARMGIWQAMEMLDTLVDESDPDVSFSVSITCFK
jgi:hypothetical protein